MVLINSLLRNKYKNHFKSNIKLKYPLFFLYRFYKDFIFMYSNYVNFGLIYQYKILFLKI